MSSTYSTTRAAIWSIRGLAFAGLVLSCYLTWASWQPGPIVGCSGESYFSCEEVLGSKWSKWWGLPVSLLGAITYVLMFAFAWLVPGPTWPVPGSTWLVPGDGDSRLPRVAQAAWLCLIALSFLATGVAAWFILLQALVLGEFCLYCCLIHACSIMICVLVLWQLPRPDRDEQYAQLGVSLGLQSAVTELPSTPAPAGVYPRQLLVLLLIASLGWTVLIVGQLLGTEESFIVDLSAPGIRITAQDELKLTDATNIAHPLAEQGADLDEETKQSQNVESMGDDKNQQDSTLLETESSLTETESSLTETESSEFRVHSRVVHFQSSGMNINLDRLPVLGNPRAEHVLVEFLDYTCMHCRHLHPILVETLERYGGQIAIVMRPVALSKKCNPNIQKTHRAHANACEYTKLALAVWHTDPTKFPEFHQWLFESESVPNVHVAKRQAVKIAGVHVLLKEIDGADVREMLNQNVSTLNQFKIGLPLILCEAGSFSGVPKSREAFFEVLEKHLGLQPVNTTLAD